MLVLQYGKIVKGHNLLIENGLKPQEMNVNIFQINIPDNKMFLTLVYLKF